jgi:hypothetical protein
VKPAWSLISYSKLATGNIRAYSIRTDEEAEEARRRRFAGGWPSLISSSLSSAKTSNTKGRGRLSILSSTARLSLLFAIFEKAEYISLVVFEASFIRRVGFLR